MISFVLHLELENKKYINLKNFLFDQVVKKYSNFIWIINKGSPEEKIYNRENKNSYSINH